MTEQGDPSRPAIVLAHGAGSSARFLLAAFGDPVVASGRRLVAYDLRGHGASEAAPTIEAHHLDVHAVDLAAVAASTAGVVEVVGGVSLGGHAAVRAVAGGHLLVRPDAVLACLPAWLGRSDPGVGPHATVAAEVRAVGVAGVIERLRADGSLPDWLRDTLLTDYARHDPGSLAAVLLSLDGAGGPGEGELRGLPMPLAVVGWEGDPGHPSSVADAWVATVERGVRGRLAFAEMAGTGVSALGAAAVAALEQALRS